MTSLSTAISEYLTHFAPRHSKRTTKNMQAILSQFQSLTPTTLLEITPAAVDSFCTHLDRSDAYRFRGFWRWLSGKYPDETFVFHMPHRKAAPKLMGKDYDQLVAEMDGLRSHMEAPHQRLVFLCGFWHGIPLNKIRQMSFQQLYALPQRKEFYDLLAQVGRVHQGEPALGPWLGICKRSALYRWAGWSGVRFDRVIQAGNVVKGRLGIRVKKSDYQLPALNEETLGRLPVPWPRSQ